MAMTTGLASVVPMTAGSHQAGIMGAPFVFFPFGFLLILLLGVAGYLVFRSTQGGNETPETRADQALETLRRRFAEGEIDAEEFQTRKERLLR